VICVDYLIYVPAYRRADVVVTRKGSLRTVHSIYPLADARAITLSPPVRTKLSFIVSRMATQRGVEYNQMFLNACVLLDGL
jgi:hypothetical protein